ncbi:hypothetical protein BU25DRAFT_149644 [Macroventuria anomochaeta]|uniref:Uncharacterized protein n=1 Tax=Macroventuria anomochaeta TaxID=301207 RepID=A0ACB6SEB8_9PLEO|nr:uncharacterized protein BU25DRAFT_149644 [Macroventuria anomochaeta]KAF2632343.1 hypothetical protein BU25DRAFT_149644 [Macroventuria anomochaeta]
MPSTKTLEVGGGEIWHVKPGQVIKFAEGILWRDLPMFSWNLTERFQGPKLYLFDTNPNPATPLAAMTYWKNINTFTALVSVHPGVKKKTTQKAPVLANMAQIGRSTLARALEHSPGTRLGKNSELHAPAPAQWLRIAGDALEKLCAEAKERMPAGDFWRVGGGSEILCW